MPAERPASEANHERPPVRMDPSPVQAPFELPLGARTWVLLLGRRVEEDPPSEWSLRAEEGD